MSGPAHPCRRDCPDRRGGCHAECTKWKEYERERAVRYEENRRHAEHDGFSPGLERNIRQCRERKKNGWYHNK